MCTILCTTSRHRPMPPKKLPTGRWQIRWRDPTGHQRAQNFTYKADAVAAENIILADIQRGTHVPRRAGAITVTDWADQWLEGARNLRQGGRATYRRDLDRYIIPAIGDTQLNRLTDAHIDKLISDLQERLSPATVAKVHRCLRRMLNVAVQRGKLTHSPMVHVQPPRVPQREMRFLTAAQVDVLAASIDKRYEAWVLVAAWGGLRWGELAGLRPASVDLDGCRVHVVQQWTDGRWEEPKSEQSRRWVTLPGSMRPLLTRHLKKYASDLVFPAPQGGPLGSSFRNRFWLPACYDAGLATKTKDDKIVGAPRIHDLRHTAVALAIATGAHPKAIQARMGHSSITVTLDRYGHLFESLDADIADALDQLRKT